MAPMSYDAENDILAVHKGFQEDERFKGNLEAGDLVLDISTRHRVRGIEILNAREFLKEFKVPQRISDADFTAKVSPNGIIITLILKGEDREIPAKIAVPLSQPLD